MIKICIKQHNPNLEKKLHIYLLGNYPRTLSYTLNKDICKSSYKGT